MAGVCVAYVIAFTNGVHLWPAFMDFTLNLLALFSSHGRP